eukprot:gene32302-43146_t
MMTTATLTSKGQITVPAVVRTALGVGVGDRVEFVEVAPGRYEFIAAIGSVTALKGMFGMEAVISGEATLMAMPRDGDKLARIAPLNDAEDQLDRNHSASHPETGLKRRIGHGRRSRIPLGGGRERVIHRPRIGDGPGQADQADDDADEDRDRAGLGRTFGLRLRGHRARGVHRFQPVAHVSFLQNDKHVLHGDDGRCNIVQPSPSPGRRKKAGQPSSLFRCERVGEVDGAWAVARNRCGPLLSRYGDRMRIFGSRRGSVATGSRERPVTGFVQPARDGRRVSGPSGLHGLSPHGQSCISAGSCLRRSRFNARSGSSAARSDTVSRSIAPRRTSGSWAQDAFPMRRDGHSIIPGVEIVDVLGGCVDGYGTVSCSPCGRRRLSEARSDEGSRGRFERGSAGAFRPKPVSPLTRSRQNDGFAAVRDLSLSRKGEREEQAQWKSLDPGRMRTSLGCRPRAGA